ncbi:MAG: quinone oxidoreductase [Chloroflexales bacterium]|nr:quinone oxidoreductase [Chloroflexales bacterium]
MYAIRVHETGGTEQLSYAEVPLPEPGSGQVRVKVAAVGVNFIDIYHRTGLYPLPRPFTPGLEVAGVIDAVGPDVSEFTTGDQVATALAAGGYAEYALAPAEKLVRVPAQLDMQQAAAAMLQGFTAHYLSHSTFPLKAGDTALVHAAAGGVGRLLVQMAKKLGARVFGTAGSEEKAQLARSAGADEVILYKQEDFAAAVRSLTNGRGVDVVYDSVGVSTFEGSLDSLRPRGYLVLYGQSSGPIPPFNPSILNAKGSLFLTRPTLAHYIATREELNWRANDLFGWLAAGELTLRIDRTYPLSEVAAAHRALEGRETAGKILLIP